VSRKGGPAAYNIVAILFVGDLKRDEPAQDGGVACSGVEAHA
jgi:hypothetical protein